MSHRTTSCPWQKVITTEKFSNTYKNPETRIVTKVSFGECLTNCPFYDVIGNYCRRINKHNEPTCIIEIINEIIKLGNIKINCDQPCPMCEYDPFCESFFQCYKQAFKYSKKENNHD